MVVALAAAFPAANASAAAEASASASDVIVTASRQPQAAQDVLADNVVISAEQIALSGAASVTDLLRMQRGIEIASNGGSGANASVFMR
ncbi:TonB-dependent receptor, partial [Undibacterium sp. 10I3]|nr:TonB-dependent receptor [Undibacterium sp. 10I3]